MVQVQPGTTFRLEQEYPAKASPHKGGQPARRINP